jgi:hypothetical protein
VIDLKRINVWMLLGGALIIIGSMMPWATMGFISISGTRGDGALTLVGGLIVLGLAFAPPKAGVAIAGFLISGACGLIALTAFGNMAGVVLDAEPTILGSPEIGTGLYIMGLGATIGVAGSLVGWFDRNKNEDTTAVGAFDALKDE